MKAAQVSRGVPPALKAAQVAMEYQEDLERLRQREAAVSSREAAVAASVERQELFLVRIAPGNRQSSIDPVVLGRWRRGSGRSARARRR